MAMTTQCPHCGATRPLADDAVGATVKCEACDRTFEASTTGSAAVPLVKASVASDAPGQEPVVEALAELAEKGTAELPEEGLSQAPSPKVDETSPPAAGESSQHAAYGSLLWKLLRLALMGLIRGLWFYSRCLHALWEQSRERPQSRHDSRGQEEIRLSAMDRYVNAKCHGIHWDVRLPDLCAVCGKPSEGDAIEETHSFPNLTWPLCAPVAGFLVGAFLSLFFWNLSLIPVGVVAGFILGYLLRTEAEVWIRFYRCREHAESKRYPRVAYTTDLLVVVVGNRPAKQKFLDQEKSGSVAVVAQRAARATPVSRPAAEPAAKAESPAPIPLADEIHATVVKPPPEDPTTTPPPE